MKTTETQEMLDAVREFSAPEYVMTEAEANALVPNEKNRNKPTIKARQLPHANRTT